MWCKPSPFLYPLCSLFSADLYLKGLMILYHQDMLIRLLRVPSDPQNEGATGSQPPVNYNTAVDLSGAVPLYSPNRLRSYRSLHHLL